MKEPASLSVSSSQVLAVTWRYFQANDQTCRTYSPNSESPSGCCSLGASADARMPVAARPYSLGLPVVGGRPTDGAS